MQPPFEKRRDAVRRKFKLLGADAMLVSDETNVTYLTGFTGDSSYLLLTTRQAVLLSDSRYTIQIDEECPQLDREIRTAQTTLLQLSAKAIKAARPKALAVEADQLVKSTYDQLASELMSTHLVDTSELVEGLRAIKDKSELENIRGSIQIAERAFEVIRAQLRGDQTERQIAHNLEHQMRQFGASRCAFDPIVGAGSRGALPHGQPSQQTIGGQPFVLIDWGAQFQGYASDLTRILVTGKISPKLQRIYDVVLRAQKSAISKLRPGVKFSDVDRAARKVIEDAGHGRRFGHGLGHGFGLQIHEQPRLSPVATGALKSGMVVTIEPGIYLLDWGGVRIEDDVLITRDGCEVLTSVPKQLEQSIVDLI